MKLSEIKDERALDTLADILDPAAEILADPEFRDIIKSGQPKLKAAAYVIRNHKKSVIEILARLDGAEPSEYSINLLTLPKKVLDVLSDPEITSLFTSQAQENA